MSFNDSFSNDVETAAFLAYEDGRAWDDEREDARREMDDGQPQRRAPRAVTPALAEYDDELRQAADEARRCQEEGVR